MVYTQTPLSSSPPPWLKKERIPLTVIFQLIHTDSNRELLKDVPSIPFLDLSFVFYLFLSEQKQGHIAALIHNRHMKSWNLSPKQLFQMASENTPRLLPPKLQLMSDLIEEASEGLPLYVLSNRTGACGACACLYPHVLKNFANLLQKDLYILPSSIHEVLLLPSDGTFTAQELSLMVSEINRSEVPLKDRLSDHVYFYSRKDDQILFPGKDRLPS